MGEREEGREDTDRGKKINEKVDGQRGIRGDRRRRRRERKNRRIGRWNEGIGEQSR